MRNGLSKDLIERILGGQPRWTIAELEAKFPPRNLPDGAMVTRVAPSPTGQMHLGTLYQAMIDKKLAQQSGGVFILRIEDTDTKREVDGAVDVVIKSLTQFGLIPDEGPQFSDKGYGSYYQSERKDIYHSVVAELLSNGHAYPCFLSPEEMEDIRKRQTDAGFATGIYGQWATWRNASEEEIIQKLNEGMVPSIRLYSTGSKDQRIFVKDAARGSISFPENEDDIVLIKSNDGLPTYHFAHLVDDHFMRTTNVIRGQEWLPSLPLHIQMFKMMGWNAPTYIHTGTLDKLDEETGNQRKFSKRKDPESTMSYYMQNGWPPEAVLEYLFNIANSAYEEDKTKGKVKNIWDAELKIKKIPTVGALFDMKKLEWWSREFISTLAVDDLTERVWNYSKTYNESWDLISNDKNYLMHILGIERDDPKRIRKDFITWKQTLDEIKYFFVKPDLNGQTVNKSVLQKFVESFDLKDDKDLWWSKIVQIATELGVKNGEVAMNLRVALTGRTNTPDLYSIMQVMGDSIVQERIKNAI
jgi:glutamyl-tRNA synthetase